MKSKSEFWTPSVHNYSKNNSLIFDSESRHFDEVLFAFVESDESFCERQIGGSAGVDHGCEEEVVAFGRLNCELGKGFQTGNDLHHP